MNFSHFLNQPFTLLDETRHRWVLIAFCTIFGIIFINVFVPFNINRWSNDSGFAQFMRLSGFGIIAGLILFFSQIVVRKLWAIKKYRNFTFILWFSGEMTLMSMAFLFYQSHQLSVIRFLKDIPDSIKYTLPGILIPYSLSLLFISQIVSRNRLNELKTKAGKSGFDPTLLDFPDEKGVVRFSVASDHVYYLESADNYVIVFYLSGNKLAKQLLRSSMKNMEMLFSGLPFKRCHRSFMVNLQKIEFVNHGNANCSVKLSGVEKLIPVSRKFYPEFKPYRKRNL
ncbi:LytR/AlgR family response regulator transcription factor [Gaoshiqia sp. Z1-71]|uniref:LytR/AlgR family response regulator transcription factor n=1 Tax=Gaoshiqia hydrogeniformans TaxID=3290090 RepID=UPI003BF78F43